MYIFLLILGDWRIFAKGVLFYQQTVIVFRHQMVTLIKKQKHEESVEFLALSTSVSAYSNVIDADAQTQYNIIII